jgi:HEAT repeat protein
LDTVLWRLAAGKMGPTDARELWRAFLTAQLDVSVAADGGSVAIGGSAINSPITIYGPGTEEVRRAIQAEREAIAADQHARSLRAYSEALRRYCARLPYVALDEPLAGGLPRSLEDVYVPVRLRPVPAAGAREAAAQPADPLTITEVLRRATGDGDPAHVLVLGGPGSGKSSLLRHIAPRAWDEPKAIGLARPHLALPVGLRWLALAEGAAVEARLADALDKGPDLTLSEPLPPRFFADWPRRIGAPWLLLLDGLDEVPEGERLATLRWLRDLLEVVGREGHHVVLTSRPSVTARALESLCAIYALEPFTAEQQRELVRRLVGAEDDEFLRLVGGEDDEFLRLVGGEDDEFLQDPQARGVGAAEGAPLLLTIAGAVRRRDGRLPERRAALYRRFVDISLEEARQRGLEGELGERVAQLARPGLERLALHMTEQVTGCAMPVLAKVAGEYLRQALQFGDDEAAAEGKRFVEVMGRRSGVFLVQAGTADWMHPTFRDYLAAAGLARAYRPDDRAGRNYVARWRSHEWREVVRLLLSVWSDENVYVTAPLQRMYRWHFWRSRRDGVFFAGMALAEGALVHPGVDDRIVRMLSDWVRRLKPWERRHGYPSAWDYLFPHPLDALVALGTHERAIVALEELARDHKLRAPVRVQVAEALRELGRNEAASAAFLALARDPRAGWKERCSAARALGELGRVEEAAPLLLALAQDPAADLSVRFRAAKALGEFGRVEEATPLLLAVVQEPAADYRERSAGVPYNRVWELAAVIALVQDPSRYAAAEALRELGQGEAAAAAFLALAQEGSDSAARALGELGHVEAASAAALTLAQDPHTAWWVRLHAAEALRELGQREAAAATFLALARDPWAEWEKRYTAARALGELGRVEEAAPLLLALAQDPAADLLVRFRAAAALDELGQGEAAAAAALALAEDPAAHPWVAEQGAGNWGNWARREDDRFIEAVAASPAIAEDPAWEDRLDAAKALFKKGRFDEAAAAWLAIALDPAVDWPPRFWALGNLYALGRLEEYDAVWNAMGADAYLETSSYRHWADYRNPMDYPLPDSRVR